MSYFLVKHFRASASVCVGFFSLFGILALVGCGVDEPLDSQTRINDARHSSLSQDSSTEENEQANGQPNHLAQDAVDEKMEAEPAFTLSVVELSKEFTADKDGTLQKYNDQTLRLNGVLSSASAGDTPGEGGSLLVNCDEGKVVPTKRKSFACRVKAIRPFPTFAPGQIVVIQGTFWVHGGGFGDNVGFYAQLRDCTIVDYGKTTVRRMTIDELIKADKEGQIGYGKELDDVPILVMEGTLTSKNTTPDEPLTVDLKGSSSSTVKFYFGYDRELAFVKASKEGDKVSLFLDSGIDSLESASFAQWVTKQQLKEFQKIFPDAMLSTEGKSTEQEKLE